MWRKLQPRIEGAVFALICAGICLAQTPAFEVAAVRVAPASERTPSGVHVNGMRVDISRLYLNELIEVAYRVRLWQVSGPDWIRGVGATPFNIEARMPEGSTKEQMPDMLQSLLVERFGLTVHKETRSIPAWALTVAKEGPKLEPAPEKTPIPPVSYTMTAGYVMHQVWYRLTISQMCKDLSNAFGRPVMDETGLTGEYKITLDISTNEMAESLGIRPAATGRPDGTASEPAGTPMLFDSMKHMGLKLESKKEPVETIVVDHVEKMPTEN